MLEGLLKRKLLCFLATPLARYAKNENVDVFLMRSWFLELPPRCSEKQKSSSKAFKTSAISTPSKAISQCGLAFKAWKNMETNDAKNDRKSQILVLFDVLEKCAETWIWKFQNRAHPAGEGAKGCYLFWAWGLWGRIVWEGLLFWGFGPPRSPEPWAQSVR